MTKVGRIPHQVGVFLGTLGGFFIFLLISEFVVDVSPPLLISHHPCESSSEFGCALRNVVFFSLSGITAGFSGAIIAWRANRGLIPVLVALIVGALFVVISALAGQPIHTMPFFTNFPAWPSWLTVPFPIILSGLAMFIFVRRIIRA